MMKLDNAKVKRKKGNSYALTFPDLSSGKLLGMMRALRAQGQTGSELSVDLLYSIRNAICDDLEGDEDVKQIANKLIEGLV